jgi:hypothetical protein
MTTHHIILNKYPLSKETIPKYIIAFTLAGCIYTIFSALIGLNPIFPALIALFLLCGMAGMVIHYHKLIKEA